MIWYMNGCFETTHQFADQYVGLWIFHDHYLHRLYINQFTYIDYMFFKFSLEDFHLIIVLIDENVQFHNEKNEPIVTNFPYN